MSQCLQPTGMSRCEFQTYSFKETCKETKDTQVGNKHTTSFKLKLSFRIFICLPYLQIMIICETVFTLKTTQGHFASMTEAWRPRFNFILQTNFTTPMLLISKFLPVSITIL